MSLALTPATIEILKNLAAINQTLLFPKGSNLLTRSVKKHTYADVKVTEKFPRKFTIFDLNQFISVLTQFDKPVLNFDESDLYVKLSDESGGLSVKYVYGDEGLAYIPDPKRQISLPSEEISLKLTEAEFKSISAMARTLGTPELALESDGKSLRWITFDGENSSTNTVESAVDGVEVETKFRFVWHLDYMKFIPGNYDVAVSKEGISRFKHSDMPIIYHVMLEAKYTTYDE